MHWTFICTNSLLTGMEYRLMHFLFAVACTVDCTIADSDLCTKLTRAAYCYQENVYRACTTTCSGKLLDIKYVQADCPWGNNGNVITNDLDEYCAVSVTQDKCGEFCINPQAISGRVLGWKCCKACVDICGDAPQRDTNFEDRYPAVYSHNS